MIFTQEQINEIKQRLSLSGIKDSELDKLNLLEHPITGKEVITIVKDGENLRISVEDLYEEFAKYIEQSENKEDFFNVSAYLGRLDPEFENAAKRVGNNFMAVLPKMINYKSIIQREVLEIATRKEMEDVRDCRVNQSMVDKLARLAKRQWARSGDAQSRYCAAMAVATIVKEYDWGTYYLVGDGMWEMACRIQNA